MYGSTYGTFQYGSIPDAGRSIVLTESITLTATFLKITSRLLTESLTLTDTMLRIMGRTFLEVITLTDTIINAMTFLSRRVGILKGTKATTNTLYGTRPKKKGTIGDATTKYGTGLTT